MDDIELLQSVSLFSNLNIIELKRLMRASVERSFEAGETIVEQGNAGVGLFIIKSGQVRVYKVLDNDTEVEIATNGPGDVIGEMSVLDGAERTASVSAKTEVTCLVLATWSLRAALDAKPHIAVKMLPIIMQKFRETSQELTRMRIGRAED